MLYTTEIILSNIVSRKIFQPLLIADKYNRLSRLVRVVYLYRLYYRSSMYYFVVSYFMNIKTPLGPKEIICNFRLSLSSASIIVPVDQGKPEVL